MVWIKNLYRLLSTALFSICLSVLKSIFRELGRAERKSSHKQTLMLYGELFVRQYDFIAYYFPEILLIFPLSSLFSFMSERIVTKTIKITSSRRDGKYLQLLFSRMHRKKIDVGDTGQGDCLFIRIHKLQNCNVPKRRFTCSFAALISGTPRAEGGSSCVPKLSHRVHPTGLVSPSLLPKHYWAISFSSSFSSMKFS